MKTTHAIVVGGSRGIGRVIARRLAEQGHKVSSLSRGRSSSTGPDLPGVMAFQADLRNSARLKAAINRMIRRQGKPGILVFCQRFRGSGDAWSGEIETSLSGTRALIERLANRFDPAFSRSIVIIGSVAGHAVALEQPVSYHVGKGGLEQLIRFYAVSLGKKNIRVNGVAPGLVLKIESREFILKDKRLCDQYRSLTPLDRLGTPEDVAGVVSFLADPASSFVTGQIITVDGGLSLLTQESLLREVVNRTRRRP
jgi:NAD(P)-dependent dehydrogenase (short-subunit alcohol dehydrogenase family)